MIQCSPNPRNPLERHPLSIHIEIYSHQPQSHLSSRSPRSSLSPTLHTRRLPYSPPTPIFRKECRLDRLTGTGPPQYVAASIPYRVPLKLAAHGNTAVKSCPFGQASPVGANWSRNLTLSIHLVFKSCAHSHSNRLLFPRHPRCGPLLAAEKRCSLAPAVPWADRREELQSPVMGGRRLFP